MSGLGIVKPMSSAASPNKGPAFQLHRVRQTKAGRVILHSVTLEIPRGRITVLMGSSGAGKTSLLRILNRLDEPRGGEVSYDGRPLTDYPVAQLRRRVGFVFQTPVMFPGTVRENLRRAAEIARMLDPDFSDKATKSLELAELDASFLDREGNELSVGQQQRVNLARTLMTRPEVLLLDEPTSALDSDTSTRLLRTVRSLRQDEGLTVVLATHRVEEARQVGDVAVMLRDGRVLQTGDVLVEEH